MTVPTDLKFDSSCLAQSRHFCQSLFGSDDVASLGRKSSAMALPTRFAGPADFQSLLEDMTRKAEAQNCQLRRRLEEMTSHTGQSASTAAGPADVKPSDLITIRVSGDRFDRHVSSTTTFQDFARLVAASPSHAQH
jgi:hypothetical protein